LRQKGPVSYLVRVGSKVHYCHVDHLLKSNVLAEDTQPMPKRLLRERIKSDVFFPADNEPDIELETQVLQTMQLQLLLKHDKVLQPDNLQKTN